MTIQMVGDARPTRWTPAYQTGGLQDFSSPRVESLPAVLGTGHPLTGGGGIKFSADTDVGGTVFTGSGVIVSLDLAVPLTFPTQDVLIKIEGPILFFDYFCGFGGCPDGEPGPEFTLTVVPEPGSLLLLAVGVYPLLWCGKRSLPHGCGSD